MPIARNKFSSRIFNIRTSNLVIVLLSVILLGVLSGGYLVVEQLNTLRKDASAINNLGVVRGSIQLISKREIQGTHSIKQIKKVDGIFSDIIQGYLRDDANIAYMEEHEIGPLIMLLAAHWKDLKELYNQHPEQRKYADEIMSKSEECWLIADELVYKVQKLSESKLMSYRNLIIQILAIICLLIIVIITIVYRVINRVIERDAVSDPLTGLFNRKYFNKVLAGQIALFERYETPFTLSLIDIDFFKQVNDNYGHPRGDCTLKKIALLLTENSRDADHVFRLGGEEFGIISPHTSLDKTQTLAEKYRTLVSEADFDIDQNITISIGIAQSFYSCSSETLYKQADTALYQAKASGRNQVVAFSDSSPCP